MPKEISFVLPWPPSVNQLYGNRVAIKGKYGFRYMKKKGKKYVDDALLLMYQQIGKPKIKGEIKVDMNFCPPDNRRRDIRNLLKVLDDILVKAELIEDDSLIVGGEPIKLKPEKPGYVSITVAPHTQA